MIETRLLHQFIAVAEELHFNRAAQCSLSIPSHVQSKSARWAIAEQWDFLNRGR